MPRQCRPSDRHIRGWLADKRETASSRVRSNQAREYARLTFLHGNAARQVRPLLGPGNLKLIYTLAPIVVTLDASVLRVKRMTLLTDYAQENRGETNSNRSPIYAGASASSNALRV